MFCSGIENAKSEKEKQLKETEQAVCLGITRLNALTAPLLCMYVCTYVCMYVQCLFFLYFNNCEHVHMHMYIRRYLNLDRQSVNWS